ncbi:hypothetical protein DFH06DRAFT_357818 [Mycena polygramma]|nr:hypothetical protein DFH06DRAFT_357818 [Mycena polygramma]
MTIPRIHHSEPVFPRELEREMFETTALMYPGQIPSLLRVARRVLLWSVPSLRSLSWDISSSIFDRIEPLMYRIIDLAGEPKVAAGLRYAMSAKLPEFFHAVRHLGLQSEDLEPGDRLCLLRVCNRVTNFGAWRSSTDPTLLPLLAQMRIQRLAVNVGLLFGGPIELNHALFRSVTHLDMFGSAGVVEPLPQLSTLPALTHLCLDHLIARDDALLALAECPRLNILLVQWSIMEEDDYMDEQVPHVYDIRFVIGTYGDYWDDWVAGAKGFPDAWSKADDFVTRKRRGEIEATRYWID